MWRTVRLGDVCTLLNGRAYKKPELLSKGKYPVLRVGNFFTSYNWYHSDLELSDTKYCDNGDLLYAWSASFGPRIWEGGKVIYHYHIWRVDVDEAVVDKKFLFYWFENDKEQVKAASGTGTTMMHVSKGSMEKRILYLPPLAEQQRIVAKLDAAFAEIDSAIEIACSKEAELSSFKSSALDNIFQNLSNETKMGQVFEFVRGPFGGSLKKNMLTEEGFAVYEQQHAIRNQCSDFRYYVPREKYDEMSRFRVRPNAILMSCSGTIGKTTIVPESFVEGIINQALLMLNPNSNVLSKFATFYMQSSHFSQQLLERVEGAAQKNVASVKVLKEILIPLPSVEEQNSLVASIENLLSEISHTQETAKTIKTNYTQLKSAILAQELQLPTSEAA